MLYSMVKFCYGSPTVAVVPLVISIIFFLNIFIFILKLRMYYGVLLLLKCGSAASIGLSGQGQIPSQRCSVRAVMVELTQNQSFLIHPTKELAVKM